MSLGQELRYALRTLRKSMAFTAAAVVCIALGVGVNTTIFAITNAAYVRPLPFDVTGRLASITWDQARADIERGPVSFPNYADWRAQSTVFEQMAAYQWRSFSLTGTEEPVRVDGLQVAADLFPMIGARPAFGRLFRDADDRFGAEPVAILSDDLWRERFDADPAVLGKSLTVNGRPHTIVGVMPPRFAFPERQKLWTPLAAGGPAESRGDTRLEVLGVLRRGVTIERAQSEMATIGSRLAALYPVTNRGWEPRVRAARDLFIGSETWVVLMAMMGAVAFVLLIACANVANLLLARATARAREIAIRTAIGATRAQIIRQLLTESLIIALVGGTLGVVLARWGVSLVVAAFPPGQLPYWVAFDIDRNVLVFTLGVTMLTAIVFGLVPAMHASRPNLHETLKDSTRGSSGGVRRNRLRSALVVTEVALSLVLLVGAALMVRSFFNLQRASPGFDPSRVLTMRLYLGSEAYDSTAPRTRRVEEIERRVSSVPGVEAVGASYLIPIDGGLDLAPVEIEGRAVAPEERPSAAYAGVSSWFFRAVGVSLVAGRELTAREAAESSAVAVVNRTMAERMWPGEGAVGKRFRLSGDSTAGWLSVVGVVNDFAMGSLNRPTRPAAYLPIPYQSVRNVGLTIRTTVAPASVARAVREQIRAADPSIPVSDVMTMEEVRRLSFWDYELFGWMFSTFGGIALLLAGIGIYGVMSYAVSQRTREIGVRVALGARQRDVLALVVGQGSLLAAVGIAVGVVGGLGLTSALESLLFGVTPTDPLTFVGIALFLVAVALTASFVPARRAARVDPMIALRNE